MDVKSAFMYRKIEEEVYVCQPLGFEDPDFPNRVYKVEKALYDDIIFGSIKKSLCSDFEKMMHKKFQISSMGELTFFLGLQVKQKEDGIFISQDKYVTEILKKFGFSEVKTAMKNHVFHSKTKHIEIRHHFIRDSNEKKLIQMIKIHTDQNITDLPTKSLDVSRFQYLIASIGMLNL
ncbi:putative ribonuclease H-like domain-containing protein [Tanacetum coccineum]